MIARRLTGRSALLAACALALAACHDRTTGTQSAGAAADASALLADAGAAVSPEWLVKNDCLACHTVQMLEEQRLTAKQWGAVVKKMVGWGAPVDPATSDVLVAYLAEHYGPDAGAYDPPLITPAEATLAFAPEDDGPLARGEPARGATLYRDRCAACHGAEARGQLGVALVDRPLLYRAASFAAVIRKGKGRMDPAPDTSDGEIADLLAHLRAALPAPSPAPR